MLGISESTSNKKAIQLKANHLLVNRYIGDGGSHVVREVSDEQI